VTGGESRQVDERLRGHCEFCQFTSVIGGRTLSLCFRHLGLQHQMYDDMQIRIRIDEEGYAHATIVEWDEDEHERTYTADENFFVTSSRGAQSQ
jgi:hypothetical protein